MRNGLIKTLGGVAAAAFMFSAAAQADQLKIGFMATLSGPPAALGEHMRDGFMLALEEAGGEFGGVPTEVVISDDLLDPAHAVNAVRRLLETDRVDIVAGVIFSNVMMSVYKPVIDAGKLMMSGNAGPSPIAGAQCHENFFSSSWQNDAAHEAMGAYATSQGWERVIVMAPNYQAGRDAIAGFKRYFQHEPIDEIYTQLGQLDFSAEIARIASMQPDAIYTLMPGGMGVNLVKQYSQAGLAETIPFLSAFTVDETTLPATQEDAVGLFGASWWAPNLDTELNRAFVENFEAKYGYPPAMYAAQGYDLGRLIDAAVREANGQTDTDSLRAALRSMAFESVAGGNFSFNTNGYPIRNFYLTQAIQRDDGKYVTEALEMIFEDHVDVYVDECPLG